eukprot:8296017-Alexandrium_andersonii.AAC.1
MAPIPSHVMRPSPSPRHTPGNSDCATATDSASRSVLASAGPPPTSARAPLPATTGGGENEESSASGLSARTAHAS